MSSSEVVRMIPGSELHGFRYACDDPMIDQSSGLPAHGRANVTLRRLHMEVVRGPTPLIDASAGSGASQLPDSRDTEVSRENAQQTSDFIPPRFADGPRNDGIEGVETSRGNTIVGGGSTACSPSQKSPTSRMHRDVMRPRCLGMVTKIDM